MFEDDDTVGEHIDPSFALSNYGMQMSVVLVSSNGVLEKTEVTDTITTEDIVCFGIQYHLPAAADGNHKADFWWKGASVSDELCQRWKVGILGTLKEEGSSLGTFKDEGSTAFAILLQPVGASKRQYVRLASRFYYIPSELAQDPETVFIL